MKKSVTVLFPGQGSQFVGMGATLVAENYFSFFKRADQALGYPLSHLSLQGPESELQMTTHTQPAILTYSIALFNKAQDRLREMDMGIDRVLGHSVGEYSALVAAGALDFEDAVQAVALRGKFMQEAVPPGQGKMFAVLKVPQEEVERACQICSQPPESVVSPANYNEPRQIVISGHAQACERAVQWLGENISTPHRALELKVSAPFHCNLMKPVVENMRGELEKLTSWQNSTLPYIANIDAKEYGAGTAPATVKENLCRQIDGPVLWTQSIQRLPDDSICLESGPGSVLQGLVKKINRRIKVISLDKEDAFKEFEDALK